MIVVTMKWFNVDEVMMYFKGRAKETCWWIEHNVRKRTESGIASKFLYLNNGMNGSTVFWGADDGRNKFGPREWRSARNEDLLNSSEFNVRKREASYRIILNWIMINLTISHFILFTRGILMFWLHIFLIINLKCFSWVLYFLQHSYPANSLSSENCYALLP